jgi:RAD51-like protein 1
MRFLPTGLQSLDRNGTGGIRLGSITEVVGRAGAGKTQFALQLVLMAAKYNQGAMYIDTEKKLILERLRDMAAQRWSHNTRNHDPQGTFHDGGPGVTSSTPNDVSFAFKHPDDVLRNMTVKQPNSTEELLTVLESAEAEILHRNQQTGFPVRVLIVDSIAAPLKRDFGTNAVPQRAATAFSIAQTLKRYAEQLHLAVIVINQVGLEGQSGSSTGGSGRRHDQVAVRAALGTSWHHCVSTRILVDHEIDPHRDGHKPDSAHKSHWRSLNVIKSNWMPSTTVHFEITPVGMIESDRPEDHEAASE